MRFTWAAASAALLLCGTAYAAGLPPESPAPHEGQAGPSVGVGMICNTAEQAEHFVSLRVRGTKAEKAMQAVNAEAKDPRACGIAAIAFERDATLDNEAVDNKLVQVVRINVLAGFNGSGWQPTTGMVQYAVIEGEGEAI
jgi:hypothetical protein